MKRTLLTLTWRIIRPFLFLLNAETAHRLIIGSLAAMPRFHGFIMRVLGGSPSSPGPVTIGPLTFRGPVGLAAGLDKDGEAIPFWPSLGFGFIEVGTVTAVAQPGNPQPRMFRLVAEHGLINRMGFNNHGSEALAARLQILRESNQWPSVPVGANIGKSKVTPIDNANEDYLASVACLKPWVDYFTVNVSSPNTPGLRDLQQADALRGLLSAVVPAAGEVPVFVKFSPDLEDDALDEAVETAIETGCIGIIATNTTRSRPGTTGRLEEGGGLSGKPIWPLSSDRIRRVLHTAAGRIPVIGAGGIHSAEQAAELMEAGCAAVQVYSCMIFEGPSLIHKLNDGLIAQR
jgi:dihydroorotate dehydrogenase